MYLTTTIKRWHRRHPGYVFAHESDQRWRELLRGHRARHAIGSPRWEQYDGALEIASQIGYWGQIA